MVTRRSFLALAGTVATAMLPYRVGGNHLFAAARGDISIASALKIDLLRSLDRALDRNVLKLFRVVADTTRNRLYVTGIMSQYIAMLDGDSHAPLRTFDTGIASNAIKYLALDEQANRLYIRDGTNGQLLAIDLNTGGRIGPVPLSGLSGGMATDTSRGLLFLPSETSPGLRALDGSNFNTVFTSTAFGTTVSSLIFDPSDDVLYGLESTKGVGRIYKMRLADQSVTTITFGLNPNVSARAFQWSRTEQRFLVCAPGLGVLVLSADGRTERNLALPTGVDFQDMSLDPQRGRLFAMFMDQPAEGEVAGNGAHLWTYDGRDWREAAAFGRKVESVIANPATGRFYAPAADESTVWCGEGTATSATAIRIGDSVESVVTTTGGAVFVNSRMGGSHLVAYDPDSRAVTSFAAGTWPVVMCVDTAGRTMVVLNAWDSTLSIFELPSRRLTATLPIGLAAGTTDRLPDLAVDFSRGRAYASYPEFGKVAIVDFHNGRALDPITIAGFATGDVGGGTNQMEVAVSESGGRLLVLAGANRKLGCYDITGTTASLIAESDTPPPAGSEREGWKLLFVDAARERAFVGQDVFDVRTGRSLSTRIAKGQKVFASDDVRDVYWTVSVENETIAVHTLDRSSLALLDSETLGAADYLSPGLAVDPQRNRLYVTHLVAATFDEYQLA